MAMAARDVEIAVIGAGVVGLAIAHRLAAEGREVVVLDPGEPGSGASYGNAGAIADHGVLPVGTPAVLRDLPRLLFDRDSPLAIRQAALPALAPWLLRFARESLPARARANGQAIAALVADACDRWLGLGADLGAAEHFRRRGCLYLYDSPAARRAAETDIAGRRDLGVTVEMVTAEELGQLEPGLPGFSGGGAYFPNVVSLTDPGRVVAALAEASWQAGARHLPHRVDRLERVTGSVRLTGPDLSLTAARTVIAAGAHGRGLARQAGDRVPMDTERGYHVEWDMKDLPLTRPASPTRLGFYLCPMQGRLRSAGTVELGGLHAPPSPHRIARLAEGTRALFPDLPDPSRSWMGFRPSLPDSLPVIGPSRAGAEVIHAYGHGHLGLTLAPVTAAMVAAMVAGGPPPVDPAPYRVTRF